LSTSREWSFVLFCFIFVRLLTEGLSVQFIPVRFAMSLRSKLASGVELLGGWLSIGHPYPAEVMAANKDLDYIVIDMQHGVMDVSDVVNMISVILLAKNTPIVRVPSLDVGLISRVLDAGAHGVICPMINSRHEAAALVKACRYYPQGCLCSYFVLYQTCLQRRAQLGPFCDCVENSRCARLVRGARLRFCHGRNNGSTDTA
jgi:hypothetical protein